MSNPNIRSNASIFERRGDTWHSEKDGQDLLLTRRRGVTDDERRRHAIRKKYDKDASPPLTEIIVMAEDPELHSFTRASLAAKRYDKGRDKPVSPKPTAASHARRVAMIKAAYHKACLPQARDVKRDIVALHEPEPTPPQLPPTRPFRQDELLIREAQRAVESARRAEGEARYVEKMKAVRTGKKRRK